MPEEQLLGFGDPIDRPDASVDQDREQAQDARMIRGVRWRLVLFSGGATLVVLLLLGLAIYTAVSNSLMDQGVAQLQERAQPIVQWVKSGGAGPAPVDPRFGGRTTGTLAMLLDSDDEVVRQDFRGELPDGLPSIDGADGARAAGRDIRTMRSGNFPLRVLSVSAKTPSGSEYVTQVVQDRTAEQETLDSLLQVLFGGGVLALVMASLLGAAYATRALVPIRASLHAQRLALRRQREFAADASHELRTPLTIVRSSVEDLRLHEHQPVAEVGTALDDIDAEVSHLTSLVEDLLLLARSDSGALDLTLQPVELGDIAADAAMAMMSPASARGVGIEVDPEPVMVVGDPLRLRQVVTILVDNAVRHSPTGGTVRVRVRRDRGVAQLVVEDEGPGIRPEDLPHVFDRFWRAQNSPGGGTGLGLAIAATIVTRHGGRIGVADRPVGGAAFTVELPVIAPASRSV
jgi:two-component system, OmpR family, sensor histidine kinase CiaH